MIRRLLKQTIAVAKVAFLALALNLPLFNSAMVSAAVEISSVENTKENTLADGTVLKKTAKAVDGMVNQWDITLRVEAPRSQKTSDTILVIDTSGSMSGGRIIAAKNAANSLVDKLLTAGNFTNQVAVVSFASDAQIQQGFTKDSATAKTAINNLSVYGGTFTQAGIRKASQLMSGSTADIKNIILLSDGEPTYCYAVKEAWRTNTDNLIDYPGHGWQTPATIPQDQFTSDITGSGSSMYYRYENNWGPSNDKWYNCGNHAIAEASFYKATNPAGLYTIGLDTAAEGSAVLASIASPGKAFTSSPANLTTIFNQIAGEISSAVKDAQVVDAMAQGIKAVSIISGNGAVISGDNGKLTWNIGTPNTLVGDKYVTELTYRIEVTSDILNAAVDHNGFYLANANAFINYNSDQTGNFPVPKINPVFLKIKKHLKDDGSCVNCDFTFASQNGHEFTVKANQEKTFVIPATAVGNFALTETKVNDSVEALKQFTVTPAQITFNLGQTSDDLMAEFTNSLVTSSVNVRKQWIGKKADKAVVELQANGLNTGKTITLDAANDWRGSFDNVRRYDITGSEIKYSIVESQIDGYEAPTYSMDGDGTLVVTNKYIPKNIDITGTKIWKNGDKFNNGIRPEIKLQLFKDGVAIKDPVSLLHGTTSHTWKDLPESDIDGNVYKYTVDELVIPDNYVKSISNDGLTITNTYQPTLADITAKKIWVNGPAPVDVRFQLYRQTEGNAPEKVGTAVMLAAGNTVYTWQGMPSTDEQGIAYTYSVKELTAVPNYEVMEDGLTVTNTYKIPTAGTATATKEWINGPSHKPTIYFQLYRQIIGEAKELVPGVDIKQLTSGVSSVEWTGLEETDNKGNRYIFSVKEVDAHGQDFVPTNYSKVESGLKVVNTYRSPLTDQEIIAVKKWDGGEKFDDGVRPEVKIELWRKNGTAGTGELVIPATVATASNNYKVNFGKQLATDINGVAYQYYAIEPSVPTNYAKTEDGLMITNKFIAPTTEITVKKIWKGGEAVRPMAIDVTIFRQITDGAPELVLSDKILSQAGPVWKKTWVLPSTDDHGNAYVYSVKEAAINHFNVTYGTIEGDLIITNTYIKPITDVQSGLRLPDTGIASNNYNSLSLLASVILMVIGLYVFRRIEA